MSTAHHEVLAQRAAEQALLDLYESERAGDCGCETCVVREVLQAAWPHLWDLAQLVERPTE